MEKYLHYFGTEEGHEDYIGSTGFTKPYVSLVEETENVHYNPSGSYLTFVALEDCTFRFSGNSANYSLDYGDTWHTLSSNVSTPTVKARGRILWKANLTPTQGNPVWGIGRFSSSGKFKAEGNPLSMIYGDRAKENSESLVGKKNTFDCLFSGCTNLVSAHRMELPAKTLSDNCYSHMFYLCTSLVAPPSLPATKLASECYNGMFGECTSLRVAPALPAVEMASQCYYSMFINCSGLIEAPVLPAETLENKCYSYMFSGCTSLDRIEAMFTTTPGTGYTNEWVSGVAEKGRFVKGSGAEWNVRGVNGIPSGWTVETSS